MCARVRACMHAHHNGHGYDLPWCVCCVSVCVCIGVQVCVRVCAQYVSVFV